MQIMRLCFRTPFHRSCSCSCGHFVFQVHDQTTFKNVFSQDSQGVEISGDGWGNFSCVRGGIAVWTPVSNIAACL